jgi:hypothetical protein
MLSVDQTNETMPTPSLTLLTAPDCHLCDHAREVLSRLERETGMGWSEVSITSPEGRRLAAGTTPLRPVLFLGGGPPLAAGRLSLRRLRRDLGRLEEAPAGAGRG